MSRSNGPSGVDPEPSGIRKVMVYVPPSVHRAMKQAALDDGERSVSDVYGEAARAFLASRGLTIEEEAAPDVPGASEPASSVADLVVTVEGLGRRIEEALERGGALRSVDGQPDGTRAAEAIRAVLEVLKWAGRDGLSGPEMSKAVQGRGVRSGAGETAKAVLQAALLRGASLVPGWSRPDRVKALPSSPDKPEIFPKVPRRFRSARGDGPASKRIGPNQPR